MQRKYLVAGLLAVAITLAGLAGIDRTAAAPGHDTPADEQPADEQPAEEEPTDQAFDREAAVSQARDLLGRTDAELASDVRVSRRGEESMMLTEDYQLGRMTVELDLNDMDEWIVTAVTVELPDAPQTFTRRLP